MPWLLVSLPVVDDSCGGGQRLWGVSRLTNETLAESGECQRVRGKIGEWGCRVCVCLVLSRKRIRELVM